MKKEIGFLKKILKENDIIVFACSGGPDSMCLLNLLVKEQVNKKLKLICAHVNHNMRKESKEEWKFVKRYCEERSIIFEGLEITEYNQENFHEEAHQKRRKFIESIIAKYHADYLMTAHHGDDLTETILMRLTRGSTLNGYAGFAKIQKENGYTLVRPLITATKNQIKDYNDLHKIPYVLDSSNNKDTYTRNRYRHRILPFLKEENKNVHQKFLKFSEEICRISEFLVKYIDNALTDCMENDTLLIVELKKQEPLIQQEIIKRYLYHIYKEDIRELKEIHQKMILELIHSKKSNGEIHLPKRRIARKNYNNFFIEKYNNKESLLLELNEAIKNDQYQIHKVKETTEKSNFVLRLNSEEIAFPLTIRKRKIGDRIESKNLNGHQKIKDILIDKKIPLAKRDEIPLLVDHNDQVLWIPGIKKSKFDKELNEKYDIIYKYELSEEKKYATKK